MEIRRRLLQALPANEMFWYFFFVTWKCLWVWQLMSPLSKKSIFHIHWHVNYEFFDYLVWFELFSSTLVCLCINIKIFIGFHSVWRFCSTILGRGRELAKELRVAENGKFSIKASLSTRFSSPQRFFFDNLLSQWFCFSHKFLICTKAIFIIEPSPESWTLIRSVSTRIEKGSRRLIRNENKRKLLASSFFFKIVCFLV